MHVGYSGLHAEALQAQAHVLLMPQGTFEASGADPARGLKILQVTSLMAMQLLANTVSLAVCCTWYSITSRAIAKLPMLWRLLSSQAICLATSYADGGSGESVAKLLTHIAAHRLADVV